MKLITVSEAQKRLPELVRQAQEEAIGLTDEAGQLVGLLAGVSEDQVDDILVQTEAFKAMIAASRASLQSGAPISAADLLVEAREMLGKGRKKKHQRVT